jgi:hypothetical protein
MIRVSPVNSRNLFQFSVLPTQTKFLDLFSVKDLLNKVMESRRKKILKKRFLNLEERTI